MTRHDRPDATLVEAGLVRADERTAISRDTLSDDTLPEPSGVRRVPVDSDPWSHVGRRCHHFEITAPIGHGGMGTVYAAWDRALHRRVAVKVLLGDGTEEHERFLDEARGQARLSSPHVVHVYYVGHTQLAEHGGKSAFFAMELVEGGTLGDVLARGETLEPSHAIEHMAGVAMGLRDALAVGIVHRDIKPNNLLLDASGQVRIADFGVARHLNPNRDAELTLTGRFVGTPLYMAPEQVRGEPVDHRADMYSLGCTFYHLLAGEPPFRGASVGEIVGRQLCEKARPLAEVAPKVPRALAEVIERLLEKEPGRRFESWEAVLTALEAAKKPARRAGVPARGAACAIDVIVAITLARVFGWPGLLLHLAAITVAHARFGQTLGKWLMSIEVRSTSGERIGMLASLGRTITSLWLPLLVALTLFVTTGSSSFDLAVAHVQARDANAFARLLLATVLGNGVLCTLYAAGLSAALLHPAKRAVHDLLLSSEVVYRLP
ncbi:MAG: protein kinase [Myxococcales bacterium]|nr:protein kinase [Myxococcales bacterium]